jgi:general secretion pathway protein G
MKTILHLMRVREGTCARGRLAPSSPHPLIPSSPPAREARRQRGFTLMELLVVIAIIGILVSLAVPTYRSMVTRAKESVLRHNLFVIRDCIDQYYADKGKYPDSLESLITDGYLRKLPIDPMTQKTEWKEEEYTGQEEGQPPPLETQTGGGIWDVHSTFEGTALDGTKYTEW